MGLQNVTLLIMRYMSVEASDSSVVEYRLPQMLSLYLGCEQDCVSPQSRIGVVEHVSDNFTECIVLTPYVQDLLLPWVASIPRRLLNALEFFLHLLGKTFSHNLLSATFHWCCPGRRLAIFRPVHGSSDLYAELALLEPDGVVCDLSTWISIPNLLFGLFQQHLGQDLLYKIQRVCFRQGGTAAGIFFCR